MRLKDLSNDTVIIESDATDAAITRAFRYIDRKTIETNPHIFYMGDWTREVKGEKRKYACGVNLNYLNSKHMAQLRMALPEILNAGSLKSKYDTGASLLPHIFVGPKFAGVDKESEGWGKLPKNGAYRTYRIDSGQAFRFVKGKLLVLIPNEEDIMLAKKMAEEDIGKEWDELTEQERVSLKELAWSERSEQDEKRRKRAEKDRQNLEPMGDLEDWEQSRADDIEPEPEDIAPQEPVSSAPPPGSSGSTERKLPSPAPRQKFVRAEPGPGISTPKRKGKGRAPTTQQKFTPSQIGAANIAMPDPNRVRVDQAAPPADSTNTTDIATTDPTETPDDRPDR